MFLKDTATIMFMRQNRSSTASEKECFLKELIIFLLEKRLENMLLDSLLKMIPIKVFFQHKINPVQGAMLNFDGKMGKVLSVSGGRVLVDFNHPLAGKDVIYEVNVKRIIQNINEIFRMELEIRGDKDK